MESLKAFELILMEIFFIVFAVVILTSVIVNVAIYAIRKAMKQWKDGKEEAAI
jgi:hypothetical protein